MARDLRVKASVRAPPPTEQRNLCAGTAYDATAYAAPPHVSSDEEWVDSAAGTCSNASSQSKQGRSGELDHPRSVQDESGNGQGLQRFEFESWEDLDSYLAEYTKRTYQSFRVRINNTVATRNNKTRSTGSKKPLLPDEWENYGKTFICTHSGTYKSRGKGKKKRLQSRAMECDAQINACVQVDDDTVPTFILRVTSARLVLNHPVNKHTWQANVLDLAAKECLTDDATTLGVVMDGQVEAVKEAIRNKMAGLSEEKVLFPVNCNGNHWCFMVMNLEKGKMLISLLPNGARPSQRVQTYESGLGVQVDSYNCGVYVLLTFKVFCGAEPLGHLDKKTLQCLRYRYLRMCMED